MLLRVLILGTILIVGVEPMAMSQVAESLADPDATTLVGTAVSVSKNTLILRTQAKTYLVFVFDHDTSKPQTIPTGAEVTVTSVSIGEPGLRLARVISLGAPSAERTQPSEQTQQPPPVPVSTKRLQDDIERHTRNMVFGVRAGIGLDPEVIDIGVHARIGPLFHRDIQFRPSAEFGFGEVTKFFGVNPDVSYRLPLTPRWSSWSTYLAAGPSFGFSQQHFEKGVSGIDWGNLEFAPGLNVVAGLESRRGFLVEFRSTIYASPNPIFRLMFGYSF